MIKWQQDTQDSWLRVEVGLPEEVYQHKTFLMVCTCLHPSALKTRFHVSQASDPSVANSGFQLLTLTSITNVLSW